MGKDGLAGTEVRVVLVGEDEEVTALLALILDRNPGFRVVGQARHRMQALSMVARLQPDFVVIDLDGPDLDELEALDGIRMQAPGTKIVVCSAFADPLTLAAVLTSGADTYLDVSTAWSELIPTLLALRHPEWEPSTAAP